MARLVTLLHAWLCAMGLVVAVNPAQAAGTNMVSYVSNTGNDSANCATPATACKDFVTALGKTANYGEIDCVNTGNYSSAFTITQSVTIDCAGSIDFDVGGFMVNGAGIVVRLRNLSINGEAFVPWSIDAQNMAALYIENCVISNYNAAAPHGGSAIKFEPSANSQLFVTNTIITNSGNGGGISGGIDIVPASGVVAKVSISHSQINGNVYGIIADGSAGGITKGTITDSVVSGNAKDAITVSSAGSSVVFHVDRTTVAGNLDGLVATGGGASMLVRNSSVFNNSAGLSATNGGTLYSYGNNSVDGNNDDGSFTGTVGLK